MSGREIDFAEMIGGEFDFYGCDGQRINLDGLVYEVVGDEDCAFFEVVLSDDTSGFHELPIARVVVEGAAFNDEGYELIDLHDGHCWLRFETLINDTSERSYDREFAFEYTPKGMTDEAIP